MTAFGLVLAAGRSTRFGGANKLLAPLDGPPVAAHVARAMGGVRLAHRAVVTAEPAVAALFGGFEVLSPRGGPRDQASSLALGVDRARALGADRLLIALADMPLVTTDLLTAVLDRCTTDRPSAASDGRRRCPPACFPQPVFPALAALRGDHGARALLAALPAEAVIAAPPQILVDIDTRQDLERALAALRR
ncbi:MULTISPECIES: NTP transferase domain-containing protein [unclassified Roseitalea]|uniref:NTP transferase domain-containing protein n=1 Tax=unclassified Roseitalea TaxID=2639107 RepID=UPI00273F29C1|nr:MULTISPECIES: NTP transferase domain-containing protein [unclassified Roseitalea]